MPTACRLYKARSFTLIEMLAAMLIVAALLAVAAVFLNSYFRDAQNTASKQTLMVLNDALNRYKSMGGNLNTLKVATPIGSVLTALKTPVNWCGLTHQFLQQGFTYPARSLDAMGDGASYQFYRCNTYTNETPAAGVATTANGYGGGVGYMANNSYPTGYAVNIQAAGGSSTIAVQDPNGAITYYTSGAFTVPQMDHFTFWACTANGNSAQAGYVSYINGGGCHLTSLNIAGLTLLSTLFCHINSLTTLDVTHNTALITLSCYNNSLTTLDVRQNTGLITLQCPGNAFTSLDVTQNISLQSLYCHENYGLASIDLSHNPALKNLTIGNCILTSLDISHNPALISVSCTNNRLGPIYLGGHTPTSFTYTPQNSGYTPSLQ